jgi:Sec-independent protein secretion pathway component TatC
MQMYSALELHALIHSIFTLSAAMFACGVVFSFFFGMPRLFLRFVLQLLKARAARPFLGRGQHFDLNCYKCRHGTKH